MNDIVANITIVLEIVAYPGCLIMVKVIYVLVHLFGMTDKTFINEFVIINVEKRFNTKFESTVRTNCHLSCLLLRMTHQYSESISTLRKWRQREKEVVWILSTIVCIRANIVVHKRIVCIIFHFCDHNSYIWVPNLFVFSMIKLAWLREDHINGFVFNVANV
jgi:hypothetical protein